MKRVVLFNWPLYVIAAVATIGCFMLSTVVPPPWRLILLVASVAAVVQTSLSLFASHAVYDLSPMHHWQWLKEIAPVPADRILNIHSGYDETSGALMNVFADAEISVIDLYPALKRREPSIERARKFYPPTSVPICSTMTDWPVEDASQDLVLLAFAAHELRSHEGRTQLMKLAGKAVKENGKIVLVEHLRDLPNAVVYGPGFLHFMSMQEWMNCITDAGLSAVKRRKFTPFVEVFIICRPV